MIVTTSGIDEKHYRMVLNETVLLLNSSDTLTFTFEKSEMFDEEYSLVFNFMDIEEPLTLRGYYDADRCRILLFRWDDPNSSEVTRPMVIDTPYGPISVKFKTSAMKEPGFRTFSITVWKPIN